MEEKKKIKMSLGTVISVFIIILLTVALVGMFCYYNYVVIPKYEVEKVTSSVDNDEESNELKEDNEVITENKVKIEGIYYLVGNENSEGLSYEFEGNKVTYQAIDTVEGTFEVVDNKIKITYTRFYDPSTGEWDTTFFPNGQFEELTIADENRLTSERIVDGVTYKGEYVKVSQKVANNTKIENIDIDSKYGKDITSYISDIWIGPEVYSSCIAEFENIKSAPKDYLSACAASKVSKVWSKVKPEEMYNTYFQFSDFNTALIELFGNEANALIESSDIEDVWIVSKNSDDKYNFIGYGMDGTWGTEYIIDKIERQDNIFIVTQYEYEYKNNALGHSEGEPYKEYIYDRNDNLILKTTLKEENMGTTIVTKRYDENGKEIEITDSFEKFLLNQYRDKLSVRTIQLEYNESNNSFIIKSNKLESNVNEENSKSEYSNEKIIETDHWPLEYDFKTKKWVDDGQLAYYVATDEDKKLCIIDNEKKLVKSVDIVVTNSIKYASINRMENTLIIGQKDGVVYKINISDFTYKIQDGELQ